MLSIFQPLGVVISSGIAYGFIPFVRISDLNFSPSVTMCGRKICLCILERFYFPNQRYDLKLLPWERNADIETTSNSTLAETAQIRSHFRLVVVVRLLLERLAVPRLRT